MAGPQQYPIRAVSRITGLSVDTLRAWERRYEAVAPARGDRGRLYSDRQVDRLKQLAHLVERGHAIGSIAKLPDAALRKLDASEPSLPATAPPISAVDLAPLRRAITHYDLAAIDAFLARHAAILPAPEFIFGVILPALRDVGARWESGAICPAQEHLFSGIARGVLGALLRALPRRHQSRPIVFATPAGDRHELGLLCAAVLAAWAGQAVMYLGPDLPADDLVRAVRSAKTNRVVLAATALTAGEADLKALRRLPLSVVICAGGAKAAVVREAIGTRVRTVDSLEDFLGWAGRDAA